MKLFVALVGLSGNYTSHALADLKQDSPSWVARSEATCTTLVRSDPDVALAHSEIECRLFSHDDFLVTFEANEAAGLFVDCLAGGLFSRREVSPETCKIYSR